MGDNIECWGQAGAAAPHNWMTKFAGCTTLHFYHTGELTYKYTEEIFVLPL